MMHRGRYQFLADGPLEHLLDATAAVVDVPPGQLLARKKCLPFLQSAWSKFMRCQSAVLRPEWQHRLLKVLIRSALARMLDLGRSQERIDDDSHRLCWRHVSRRSQHPKVLANELPVGVS